MRNFKMVKSNCFGYKIVQVMFHFLFLFFMLKKKKKKARTNKIIPVAVGTL